MNRFHILDPGDPFLFHVGLAALCVSLLAVVALVVSNFCRRRLPFSHAVLVSALVCILADPWIVVFFRMSGLSTFTGPSLRYQENGGWRTRNLDTSVFEADEVERPRTSPARFTGRRPRLASSSAEAPGTHSRSLRDASGESTRATVAALDRGDVGGRTFIRGALLVAVVVWLLGAILLMARLALKSLWIWRLRRSAIPLPAELAERTRRRIFGERQSEPFPTILLSQTVGTPVAVGWFRGAVILPEDLVTRISQEQLCDVLRHEFAHVARRDPLVLFVEGLAASQFWPIPFVHWLNRQLNRVREDLCDNHVLATRGPLEYAQTLLRVAELSAPSRHTVLALGMLYGPGELESRIASILDTRRNLATCSAGLARAMCFATLFVAAVMAGGICVDAKGADPNGTALSQQQAPVATRPTTSPASRAPNVPPASRAAVQVASGPAKAPASEANPSSPERAPIRIQVWWGIGGTIGTEFDDQVDAFNQSHSAVVARVRRFSGYGAVRRELQRALQTGKLPDVAFVEVHHIASLAAENAIEPLDALLEKQGKYLRNDLLPGVLTNLTYRDKLYAFPFSRSAPLLYYNKDRFAAAGLDPEKPPRTWEELRTISAKLTPTEGGLQYGLLLTASPWIFESMVWSSGGELVVAGKAKFAEAGAKPLQLLADLIHRQQTARFGTEFGASRSVRSEFFSENAAMVLESTAVLDEFNANCSFNVGTAPVPCSQGFKNAVPMGGGAAVIPAANSAERKAAAGKLLTWLIGTQQTAKWSRNTGYLPLRESARALLEKQGFYRIHPEYEAAIKELSFARESPQDPRWGGAASRIITRAITAILRSNTPALETLKTAESEIDDILTPNAAKRSD
jgi:sn-glycerol 3-phosphate transport system substrate-binding protein